MDLDPHLHRELAVFFARRFQSAEQRRQIAALASVHAPEPPDQRSEVAWGVLLTRAAEQGRLPRLIDAVLTQPQVDAALAEVCALVLGRPWPPRPAANSTRARGVVAALAVTAGAGLALVALRLAGPAAGLDAPPMEREPTPAELAAADDSTPEQELEAALIRSALPPAANASVPPPGPRTAPTRPEPPAPATVADAPTPAVPPQTPAQVPADAPRPPAAPQADARPARVTSEGVTANHHGRCTTAAGGLVGWWHAGRTSPGAQGEVITMTRGARVRVDLPRPANHFDARSPERCAVLEGDKVRLTGAPVQIAGGSWWVPLHSGDLVAQAP